MFRLIKIEYGRDNVPEPVTLPATADVAYKEGMALYIDTATNTAKIAFGNISVEYICLETKTGVSGGKILCYRVTPQMLFEVPVEDLDNSYHSVGDRAQIYSDGLQITDAAASGYASTTTATGSPLVYTTETTLKFGALVVDTLGAASDGDCVLVRLA